MSFIHRWLVPLAFDLYQYWVGETVAKRKLVIKYHDNQRRVLEVGCSTGNIASVFLHRDVRYVGLDIDQSAIRYAQLKFKDRPNFIFLHKDLHDYQCEEPFDYIIFSGVLHHMDDATAKSNLMISKSLLCENGSIVVLDPLLPRKNDRCLIHMYGKLERGQFVREADHLQGLIESLDDLAVIFHKIYPASPFPIFSKPVVSYFALYVLRHMKG